VGREKPHGLSLWWPILARNKKSITLDLRTPDGQALARRILARADVLVEDFRDIAGYQRERTGSVLPNIAPSNVYPTKDGPILIAANRDTIWRRLAALMGQPELAGPHYQAREANVFPKLSDTPGEVRTGMTPGEIIAWKQPGPSELLAPMSRGVPPRL
jgi:crotonobetainyl-CoA:carnitine CoA-transferase CaiB-like acyl-CoA transferase